MPIDINIPDNNLQGFNQQARDELKKGIEDFSNDLIAESNRLEASLNTTSNGPEITSSIVADAKVLLRHKINKPKKGIGKTILKIGASLTSLLAGIMFHKESLQDNGYLVLYIVVIAIAILLTTLTVFKED
jgi:hypothetical protein